ncbi:MAG: glycosyltransferase family 2 protein [Caldilineales bacterium]
MPHITVTIPVYNRAHLVGRTIESVLAQSFQDWDLLVVDDGSSDDTVAVVRGYTTDPRVQLEINPHNLGLTRNWNRCLELARGPLVQVLLSDDLIDADYLQRVSDHFATHPNTGMVAASCRYIDADDQLILPGVALEPRLYAAGDEAVSALLLTIGYPHVSSIVIRRECYEKLGKFNERIWHGPDVEMDTRIAAHYDFYHFGSIHTSFRRHGSNMGNLEFLRDDFLEVDTLKKRLAWQRLSPEGLRAAGVNNLEDYLNQHSAQVATGGALVAVGYGKPALARRYMQQAARLLPEIKRTNAYRRNQLLLLWPALTHWVLQRRWKVKSVDRQAMQSVESSLQRLREKE